MRENRITKNSNRTKIDSEKLNEQLDRRGLRRSKVSLEIGYASSYISNVINEGYINKPTMVMLERLYNIKPEEYIFKEPIEEVAEGQAPEAEQAAETPQKIEIDLDIFYQTVYSAVYQAVKMAWMDE